MTAADIIAKLFVPVTKERIDKAKGAAQRMRIEWSTILEQMTPEQRQQVADASEN